MNKIFTSNDIELIRPPKKVGGWSWLVNNHTSKVSKNVYLVAKTKNHDFYQTIGLATVWGQPVADLYSIVPSGDPIPETGYYQPAKIMKIKGYGSISVRVPFIFQ